MMSNFGFGTNAKNEKSDINIESIEELQKFLSSEVRSFSEFESQMILEMKEIKHMESNLKQLEIQLKALEALMKQYNNTNEKLYYEMNGRNRIDLKKCQEYEKIILKIKDEIEPTYSSIITECRRLFLDITHELYNKGEAERAKMKEIDEKARKITSRVVLIEGQLRGVETRYKNVAAQLRSIEISQAEKKDSKANTDIGFKT